VATVQVKDEGAGTLTDLFMSVFDGTTWSAPVQLTNNAAGGTSSGVVDAAGRSLGNTKDWYAAHASVACDQSGAPVLLMTNRETSANLDVRRGGSISALGRSKAFFMRPASLSSGRAVRASVPERATDDAPTVGGQPGTAAGAPRGKYNCYSNSARQPMPWEPGYGNVAPAPVATTKYLFNLTVEDGRNYQYLNRGRGTYRADAETGMITWLSGPFAGSGIKGAVKRSADGRPVIYLDLDGSRASCISSSN
jgi:hypothetical protein